MDDKRNKEKIEEISKHFRKQSVSASVSSITSNVLPEPEGVDDKSNKEKTEEVNKNLKKQSDSDCSSSIGSKDLPEPKKIPSDEEQDMMEGEIKKMNESTSVSPDKSMGKKKPVLGNIRKRGLFAPTEKAGDRSLRKRAHRICNDALPK